RLVEARILPLKELKSVYTRTGSTREGSSQEEEDVIGAITIEFINWRERRPAEIILEEIEKNTKEIPGIHVTIQKEKGGPPAQKPIDIEISAPETALLKPALLTLRNLMQEMP
ncbi:MAG: transporter, partial [Alphaproteobacteria bacterium]|nr:transporter [Alphaproteobacteria bacterium]